MTNLKQLAMDMRDLGQLLLQQADEIDQTMNAIDLNALAVLVGNLSALGGGPIASAPFVKRPAVQPHTEPDGLKRKQTVKLTPDQKDQIREHYRKLPEKEKTKENRQVLAKAYGISTGQFSAILFHGPEQMRHARDMRQPKINIQNRTPAPTNA